MISLCRPKASTCFRRGSLTHTPLPPACNSTVNQEEHGLASAASLCIYADMLIYTDIHSSLSSTPRSRWMGHCGWWMMHGVDGLGTQYGS